MACRNPRPAPCTTALSCKHRRAGDPRADYSDSAKGRPSDIQTAARPPIPRTRPLSHRHTHPPPRVSSSLPPWRHLIGPMGGQGGVEYCSKERNG